MGFAASGVYVSRKTTGIYLIEPDALCDHNDAIYAEEDIGEITCTRS